MLSEGDFIVNLSVDVSSAALILYAGERKCLYIDTCVEPWAGLYTDASAHPSERTNYALREEALALDKVRESRATAIIAHGANPGLISHLLKQALLNVAKDTNHASAGVTPTTQHGWAQLACELGIKVIHIAERDTQIPKRAKRRGEFVNTWSCDGFVSESLQPAELGWGTHEKALPKDGREHTSGCKAAIYLTQPSLMTRVRSWTPCEGPYVGFNVTHHEAIAIADYFTLRDAEGAVVYRPTCHYAYHPCDSAVASLHELAGKGYDMQEHSRVLREDDIEEGVDELGVLLGGHSRTTYWYGSRLSIEQTRALAPHQNATGLQVTSAVLGAIAWAIEHPREGVVDAEQMDFMRVLGIAMPFLGDVVGAYSDWTPLHQRGHLFAEPHLDHTDPWQYANVRIS